MNKFKLLCPDGQSVAEGTIVRWTKKVGERVKEDEVLLESRRTRRRSRWKVRRRETVRLLKHEGEIAAARGDRCDRGGG